MKGLTKQDQKYLEIINRAREGGMSDSEIISRIKASKQRGMKP
ncbi:hypothetical protein LCGC14_0363150 [marine sediment metagenome]|uniref:Uncharacterized protein n=1 Tax=marine sediment metagenome TaxID=412755 RepID=A0A0F9TD31_9ZZZZ